MCVSPTNNAFPIRLNHLFANKQKRNDEIKSKEFQWLEWWTGGLWWDRDWQRNVWINRTAIAMLFMLKIKHGLNRVLKEYNSHDVMSKHCRVLIGQKDSSSVWVVDQAVVSIAWTMFPLTQRINSPTPAGPLPPLRRGVGGLVAVGTDTSQSPTLLCVSAHLHMCTCHSPVFHSD